VEGHDAYGGKITIDIIHSMIHLGKHFFIGGYDTKDDTETVVFTVTAPNSDREIHMTFAIAGSGILTVEVYEGSSGISGGTLVTPINSNRRLAIPSVAVIRKDPTVTLGYLKDSIKVGTAGTPAGKGAFGGEASRERELVLKKNTSYSWKMISGAAANIIAYKGEWYET